MFKLIVADDFTGSNDAGVQFVNKGMVVDVVFDWEKAPISSNANIKEMKQNECDVIVINTESRSISIEEAQQRIKTVISNYPSLKQIYKKIDSTLRGNIGAEIETLLNVTQYKAALIIPAFPNMKRITKNGQCYIDGVELIKTEFATDPKTPIYSSSIKKVIEQQTDFSCGEIYLDAVRNYTLKEQIELLLQSGNKIIIIDAETNDDLQIIVSQILPLLNQLLLVGSAGIINFIPTDKKQNLINNEKKTTTPILVIAGSMSEKTQQQINYTVKNGDNNWQVVNVDLSDLLPNFSLEKLNQYRNKIQKILDTNQHCIVRTCSTHTDRFKVDNYCQQYHLSRTELGEKICDALGQLVAKLKFDNLFLTGGDVAISIAKSLGAIGFRIQGEVSTGVPYGKLLSKKPVHFRVFTKAGGFGEQDIFLKSLEFI
ncbi:four-carbon acid sugar kinase family protein [Gilliamella sp. Pas-s95]|uniref:D-threonate kinase n=1 Tax=Gilliamella sp. Pas-s95 TaxID=2687317 RepID=UPI00132A36E4|nr:four-carbon acid sugar kinase family protein [Gilliamella sp. Pas-s95]MWN06459.1 hypothetical protein [Gilliamella sp. Pas-s95]